MPPRVDFDQSRYHHANGDRADGAARQHGHLLPASASEPMRNPLDKPRRGLAIGVDDGGDCQGQQELHHQQTETADEPHEPLRQLPAIRSDHGDQIRQAAVLDLGPEPGDARADQRQVLEPVRRGGNPERHRGLRQTHQLVGMPQNGCGGQPERCHEHQQDNQRHHNHGEGAAMPQRRLDPQQQRPGSNHDGDRPHSRRQERPHDVDRAQDQHAEDQNREQGARQIVMRNGNALHAGQSAQGSAGV